MSRKRAHDSKSEKEQGKRTVITAAIRLVAILALPGIIKALQTDKPSVFGTGAYSAADLIIPQYAGSDYVETNGNIPFFRESDVTAEAYEEYSPLDRPGRRGQHCRSIRIRLTQRI